MYKTIRQGLPLLALLVSTFSIAHETAPAAASMGASSHAPVGVMGDHHHKVGEWMLSYRYMAMEMEGNLDGGATI